MLHRSFVLFLLFGSWLALMPNLSATTPVSCPDTTEAENVALARSWHEDVINDRNPAVLEDILAPTVVHHAAGDYPEELNANAVGAMMEDFLAGFTDLHYTTDFFVVDGNMVVQRYTATGTQDGPFGDRSASGQSVTWTGINIFRIECGRIAEVWSEVDDTSRNRQLSTVLPATPTP